MPTFRCPKLSPMCCECPPPLPLPAVGEAVTHVCASQKAKVLDVERQKQRALGMLGDFMATLRDSYIELLGAQLPGQRADAWCTLGGGDGCAWRRAEQRFAAHAHTHCCIHIPT